VRDPAGAADSSQHVATAPREGFPASRRIW